jgi:hypothetical protein
MTCAVEDLDLHPEPAAQEFTGIDRADAVAEGKAAVKFGPAEDSGELDIILDLPVDVVKTLLGNR